MNRLNLIVLLFPLVAACSSHYASNAENEYLQSQQGSLIQVPAPLTKQDFSQYYLLPTPHQDTKVNIDPPIDTIQENHEGPS